MRLILRGAASRLGDVGSLVVAASPDSLARQPWQWDIRVSREPIGQAIEHDGAGIGPHFVCVRVDPELVTAELTTDCYDLAPGRTVWAERPAEELWLAVVETGAFRHGPLDVVPGDVIVWEGDDPLGVDVTSLEREQVALAVARLRRTDGEALRWVP
jgi:hypothetical protein